MNEQQNKHTDNYIDNQQNKTQSNKVKTYQIIFCCSILAHIKLKARVYLTKIELHDKHDFWIYAFLYMSLIINKIAQIYYLQ